MNVRERERQTTMLSLSWTAVPSHLRARRRRRVSPSAKKTDPPEAVPPGNISSISRSLPSKSLFARSAIAIFALGFVDAGYSGDWSRIGAVSKETEELLKVAAYLVVPFCVFLIFALSRAGKGKEE